MTGNPLGSPTMQLETARLTLRPLSLLEVDRMVSLANNERVAHMTARMPHPYVRKDARDFIVYANKALILGDELALGIHLREPLPSSLEEDADTPVEEEEEETESLIGVGGFLVRDGLAEIGYWIGEPYWGKGFGSEAATAIVEHIRTLGLFTKVHGRVLPDNAASVRILESLGFTYTRDVTEAPKNREGTVRLRCFDLELEP